MPIQVIRGAGTPTRTRKNKSSNTKNLYSKTKTKWSYIPLNTVNQLEKLADYYNISHKARGLQKPTKSDDGFLTVYRSAKGNPSMFELLPVKKGNPNGEKWEHHREDFCNRRYAMIKGKKNYGLYDSKTGLPTVMHTNMLMWACSPDNEITRKSKSILDKLEQVKKS